MDPKESIINELQKAAADVLATERAMQALETAHGRSAQVLNKEYNEQNSPLLKQSANAYERYADYTEALRLIEEEGMDPLMARMTASAGNAKKRIIRHHGFDDPFGHNSKHPYGWSKHQQRMKLRRRSQGE